MSELDLIIKVLKINIGFYFSLNRAEQIALNQQQSLNDKENAFNKHKTTSLFRRKSARRAKTLGRDHWDDVIFCK